MFKTIVLASVLAAASLSFVAVNVAKADESVRFQAHKRHRLFQQYYRHHHTFVRHHAY